MNSFDKKEKIAYLLINILDKLNLYDKVVPKLFNGRFIYSNIHFIWKKTKNKNLFYKNNNRNIIIFSSIPSMHLTHLEIILGMSFKSRGFNVIYIFDDGVMPLNELTTKDVLSKYSIKEYYKKVLSANKEMFKYLPLKLKYISELIETKEISDFKETISRMGRNELLSYTFNGINLGIPAFMSALRYFKMGNLPEGKEYDDVLREYVISSYISLQTSEILAYKYQNDIVLMSHGIYSSWEPALKNLVRKNVYTVTYDRQPGKNTYQFNVNEAVQTQNISLAWKDIWQKRHLSEKEKKIAIEYLKSRESYKNEAEKFNVPKKTTREQTLFNLGIKKGSYKYLFLLFSNLVWDAAAVGKDIIFNNTIEWIRYTIEIIKQEKHSFLIIKPHPAEKTRGTNTPIFDEIRRIYKKLPKNVIVLKPDTNINTYSLMDVADIGIVHTSTAGLEMAVKGKPVITVSLAHYRNKGFTFDPENLEDYKLMLESPLMLTSEYKNENRDLALKYFYVRYFKYQYKLPFIIEDKYLHVIGYNIKSFDDIIKGENRELDFVIDSIINRRKHLLKD